MEPVWLPAPLFLQAVKIHFPELLLLREDGWLSALNSVEMAYHYGQQSDVYVLAGLYAQRIAKAHAFADCNKRTALMAALWFLNDNNAEHNVSDVAAASIMERLAASQATPEDFADIYRCRA